MSCWPGKDNLLPGLAGADGAAVDPVLRLHLEPNLFDDTHQQAIHVVVQSRAHLRSELCSADFHCACVPYLLGRGEGGFLEIRFI
jgi:hypothetical protein